MSSREMHDRMPSRREFFRKLFIAGGMVAFNIPDTFGRGAAPQSPVNGRCTIYRAVNGTPAENVAKVVELLGGIQAVIGDNDIVVIKPNMQWWNQGATNLAALEAFVELCMDRPGGFHGEVVIAENCHRGKDPSSSPTSGWAGVFERNSSLPEVRNLNELAALLKKRYGRRYATVHWLDVAAGGKRVRGPVDGAGYVYCDGAHGVPLIACSNDRDGEQRRETIMTYPVFITDREKIVDLKNGVWEHGAYTQQPLKLINFPALNHHGSYCGVTSAVKNYLGITDLSGGPDPHANGRLTGRYYNFHAFPFDKWGPGPAPGMLGKEIGTFLRTIRKADLNITTAEWTGLTSRTGLPVARPRVVMACTDPVALDVHAAKYVLYPNSRIPLHDPDNDRGPLRQYLAACAAVSGGHLDEAGVRVLSYDCAKHGLQDGGSPAVTADITWGADPTDVMKYLAYRFVFR